MHACRNSNLSLQLWVLVCKRYSQRARLDLPSPTLLWVLVLACPSTVLSHQASSPGAFPSGFNQHRCKMSSKGSMCLPLSPDSQAKCNIEPRGPINISDRQKSPHCFCRVFAWVHRVHPARARVLHRRREEWGLRLGRLWCLLACSLLAELKPPWRKPETLAQLLFWDLSQYFPPFAQTPFSKMQLLPFQ